jgi:hypothetical protein
MDAHVNNQTSRQSFIEIIRRDLGTRQWQQLDKRIIRRFTHSHNSTKLRYLGVVHWVYCSPIGYLIGKLLRPFSLLPDRCARNCQFEFVISEKNSAIQKQRKYFLDNKGPFTFRSVFTDQPGLLEEFGGRLGMNLKLLVTRGALLFRDSNYFWAIARWRLPLPRWLTVGRFELLHRSLDEHRFQVIIRIAHPLFGTLFYQRGVFFDILPDKALTTAPVAVPTGHRFVPK